MLHYAELNDVLMASPPNDGCCTILHPMHNTSCTVHEAAARTPRACDANFASLHLDLHPVRDEELPAGQQLPHCVLNKQPRRYQEWCEMAGQLAKFTASTIVAAAGPPLTHHLMLVLTNTGLCGCSSPHADKHTGIATPTTRHATTEQQQRTLADRPDPRAAASNALRHLGL